VLVPRDFDAPLLREDFAAPPLARFALEAVPVDLRALDERLDPAPDDLARGEEDFFAPLLEPDELLAALPVERFAVEREPADLRAPVERLELPPREADEVEPELPLELAPPSIDHLPLITRCAASATASAMSDPSFVALETTLLAA
jgi:hypothetical protein